MRKRGYGAPAVASPWQQAPTLVFAAHPHVCVSASIGSVSSINPFLSHKPQRRPCPRSCNVGTSYMSSASPKSGDPPDRNATDEGGFGATYLFLCFGSMLDRPRPAARPAAPRPRLAPRPLGPVPRPRDAPPWPLPAAARPRLLLACPVLPRALLEACGRGLPWPLGDGLWTYATLPKTSVCGSRYGTPLVFCHDSHASGMACGRVVTTSCLVFLSRTNDCSGPSTVPITHGWSFLRRCVSVETIWIFSRPGFPRASVAARASLVQSSMRWSEWRTKLPLSFLSSGLVLSTKTPLWSWCTSSPARSVRSTPYLTFPVQPHTPPSTRFRGYVARVWF
eukprot:m.1095339 g.1095339  ORF g.1095339 m.1095339 type:complete len:336 (+) comp24303_c1_seq37:973-1980(+)